MVTANTLFQQHKRRLYTWTSPDGPCSVNLKSNFLSMLGLCSLPVFYLGPNYGGDNEDYGDLLQKVPCTRSVPPTLQQATIDPRLCPRLLDTHRQVWVSLLWGHCSFLLGPGAQKVLLVPSKSLFPQSCVSSGSSVVGLMATSSKRAYAIPRSTAPRAPAPAEATAKW